MSASVERYLSIGLLLVTMLVAWGASTWVVNREVAATLADNSWYIRMAAGDYAVPKPFNTRIVVPWLAGRISTLLELRVDQAFLTVQLAAFLVLHLFAALAMRRLFQLNLLTSVWVTGICLTTQGFLWLVGALYYPDLLFLAWTAVAIWAWLGSRWWLVTLSLFLALITRDSSALPLLVMILVGAFIQRQKIGMLATVLALVGQQVFFKLIFSPGLGNVHGLSELFYLPLKLVSNSSRAYFGLRMWSNTLGENPITAPYNPIPPVIMELPSWLHVGGIHAVGFYPWSFQSIVTTFAQMTVTYGLPLVLALVLAGRLLRKTGRVTLVDKLGLPSVLILVYGLLMLALGPATGTDLPRLIMAAWPCTILIGAGWLVKTQTGSLSRVFLMLTFSSLLGWLLHFAWRQGPDLLLLEPSPLTGCLYLLGFAIVVRWGSSQWRSPVSK